MPVVLALGLDPACADLSQFPQLTPAMIRDFVDVQLGRLRALGYDVEPCLVDAGETAEAVTARHLDARTFDCVVIGAGLRAPAHLLLFEKLVNLVHARAPGARICFNTMPADTRGGRAAVGVMPKAACAERRGKSIHQVIVITEEVSCCKMHRCTPTFRRKTSPVHASSTNARWA